MSQMNNDKAIDVMLMIGEKMIKRLSGPPQGGPLLDANNRLFVLARKSRWLPNWLVAIPMVPIFLLLPYFTISPALFWLVGRFYPLDRWLNQLVQSPYALVSASELVLSLAISFLPSVLLVWLWLKFVEKRPF